MPSQPWAGSFHKRELEHSSKSYFTASLAETKSEQTSVFYFLTFQSGSTWDRLQRQPVLFATSLHTSLVQPIQWSFSKYPGELSSISMETGKHPIEKLVIIIIPYFHVKNINPRGEGLADCKHSDHIPAFPRKLLFFSHQQDKWSVKDMTLEQPQVWGQSGVALETQNPKKWFACRSERFQQ